MPARVRHVHLQCACHYPDHIVRVTLDTSESPPEISISPLLSHHLPWYKRILVAIRYVLRLGSDKHWGGDHFATVILDDHSVDQLSSILVHRRILEKVRKRKAAEGK
jgi:hypothetical protein